MATVEVLSPGALTTIQDLGRPGWAHVGVPPSGAADRRSLVLANRLVGNPDGAAALETTLTGPRLRFHAETTVALTGAPAPARIGERRLAWNEPTPVGAGEELRVGTAARGLRTYVAFRGGLAVTPILGSASTDVLTGLGPAPLRRGDTLQVRDGPPRGSRPVGPAQKAIELPDAPRLRIILGPREGWFTDASLRALVQEELTVTPDANRTGVRLQGPLVHRRRHGELPSEGLVVGCLQIPPDGRPILLLADHPTTGGYPVAAVVHSADLPLAGQLRPGQRLRLIVAA